VSETLDRLRSALRGRYTIEREIGSGGMATVYLAEDVKHHRKVALKVMRPELAATMGATRFLREIETAAQLQHPHILPLHDSGEANGFLYFVMPYVEGESLRGRLARGGELPVGDAVRVLRDVADALAHAHARGVIHRDIKPDNVLLSGRHALVTDFGVAKAVSEATGRQSITTVGVALGTPSYMAPEQAAADPHVDQRADIYALGCLAYELLAGHPPFQGDSPQQVLAAHVTQAPVPVTSSRPVVPGPLNAVVMRCLEKKPADRWQTAEELLLQLEGLMTPSGGVTPTDTRPVTGMRVAMPRRWWPVAATTAAAAVIVAGGAWALLGRGASSAAAAKPRIVVLPPRNLGPPEQAYVADGIAEEINNRLVAVSGLEVIGRTSAERYRDTDKTPRQIGEELGVQYLLALRVASEGGDAQRRLRVSAELLRGETEAQLWGKSFTAEQADDYFRLQEEIAADVAAGMGVALGAGERQRIASRPTSSAQAYDYFLRGMAAWSRGQSVDDFRDAADRFTRAVEIDPRFAHAWAGLAIAHTEMYWFFGDRSARRLDLAREALDRAMAIEPDLTEVHLARGIFYYHSALDYPHALEELRQAIARDPGRADLYEWTGYVLRRSGQFDDAIASFERAIALDPQSPRLLNGLAETYVGVGRQPEGEHLALRALDLAPSDWAVRATLVLSALAAGNLAEAGSRARAALARLGAEGILIDRPDIISDWLPLLPPDARSALDPFPALTTFIADTGSYYLQRAETRRALGGEAKPDFDTAVTHFEQGIRRRPDDPFIRQRLAQALAGAGRRDDAVREGRTAIERFANDAWEGPYAHATLAEIHLQFGERDLAIAQLEQFVAALPGARALVRYGPEWRSVLDDPRVRRLVRE